VARVQQWTGREASALKSALRLSVRDFAAQLGVSARAVSYWDRHGGKISLRPDTQSILDTALAGAPLDVHIRFEQHLESRGTRRPTSCGPRAWEYETWADDLDRVVGALSRQDFATSGALLDRWSRRWDPDDFDTRGLYLFGRTAALLGDTRRDQGNILGPGSARSAYERARTAYVQLDVPRRVAQAELSLAVIGEMAGRLDTAARQYERLAGDDRLSPRDKARSLLWVGTTLTKAGRHDFAGRVMLRATRVFEDLGEPEDWSVAHQKLALAARGAGDLARALQYIDTARTTGVVDSPMQRVRLDTAHAHVLLSEPATRTEGFRILDRTATDAACYGMAHQLRSIESIRTTYESDAGNGRR
jgi:tetratricopeptide (TPR) repeat protein